MPNGRNTTNVLRVGNTIQARSRISAISSRTAKTEILGRSTEAQSGVKVSKVLKNIPSGF
jgi:hypothetical protein